MADNFEMRCEQVGMPPAPNRWPNWVFDSHITVLEFQHGCRTDATTISYP
jgi:hypothetical protein